MFHGISKEKEVAAREFNRSQEAGQNVGLVESRYDKNLQYNF